ncbi:putative ferric-chelate reductase 1 isoform X2 [Apostichopus japonicus]|uniref:putative ferric-chelate reductase 1 isoform X2 n=1 Tax=Stichopus japonicus TaxID=307972 RepID=UPI003AB6FD98
MTYIILCILSMVVTCWAHGHDHHGHDHHHETFCDMFSLNDTTCFNYPDECTGTPDAPCEITMRMSALEDDVFTFRLQGTFERDVTSGWVSVGFSSDRTMGSDEVIMCTRSESGTVEVIHRYNEGHTNLPKGETITGLRKIEESFNENLFSCAFTIPAGIRAANTFDLNSPLYLFFGTGPISSTGDPTRHWRNPYISNERINLSKTDMFHSVNVSMSVDHDHDHDHNRAARLMGDFVYIIGLALLLQRLFLRT